MLNKFSFILSLFSVFLMSFVVKHFVTPRKLINKMHFTCFQMTLLDEQFITMQHTPHSNPYFGKELCHFILILGKIGIPLKEWLNNNPCKFCKKVFSKVLFIYYQKL